MKTFPLRVLAPERTFFDGACTSLTVPSIDGMYGLMAQHEDIVLAIVPGKLTLRDADGVEQKDIANARIARAISRIHVKHDGK